MPTENRSSDTENAPCPFCDGRVDPEGWLRGDGARGPECESCGATAPNLALWNGAQPAQQHQGEPVALAIPDECPHIIVFDDADRANEHFCGSGARPAALRRYEQISQSWNAHLFVRTASNSRDDRYPGATVADPAEVERLRIEHTEAVNVGMRYQDQRNALRAQLAERDALLLRSLEALGEVGKLDHLTDYPLVERVKSDIRLSLSTSAEPVSTAWRCGPCKLEMAGRRPCDLCSAEPIATTEIDNDALVAAVCVLRSQGLSNLSVAVEEARAALERKQ
ncbi:hypothetical protein [Pseudomonas sp. UBA6562]|uniref:hypothetical protein n=1 Tax=Pseudomonas sp. UBA6562 TaxID=1947332 RepID=UPI0025F4BE82|nr:hypothetical protein [Pseudomonas sp. UBA6562]